MERGIKKQVKRRRVVCGLSSAKICNSSPSRDENQEVDKRSKGEELPARPHLPEREEKVCNWETIR